ncbi:FR47-like protein [Sinosporangium album]|uniref:FR47-like protein n=1 Tax=Sinosporangium album TaxID=504805 RepID=A0A1G7WQV3_9ACTN|nr:GNAT family N-acetyltransferase [Sinosporangium album]SDG74248.1 FR47-like protein [Sinosporangium album]
MIRELSAVAEVAAACGDDDMTVWAAQGMRRGVRAFAGGDAVAVVTPGAARHDRIALWGDPGDAAVLVEFAVAECGPGFGPFGEVDLVREVVHRVEGLELRGAFSWMGVGRVPAGDPEGVRWLGREEEVEVSALLAAAHPDSYATPSVEGVSRWAGVRGPDGGLAAVAADAWSAPEVGLLAGVATAVSARGRGLAERVCRFVTAELVRRHGRAALLVDDANGSAIRVYERLGFVRRFAASARVVPRG